MQECLAVLCFVVPQDLASKCWCIASAGERCSLELSARGCAAAGLSLLPPLLSLAPTAGRARRRRRGGCCGRQLLQLAGLLAFSTAACR